MRTAAFCVGTAVVGAGIALAQGYSQEYRPQYHFTPEINWMNDPNGLVYHNGVYNMYFQWSPHADVWSNISWGHATSTDLTHWHQQPPALEYTVNAEDQTTEMWFTGSTVVDDMNTSGFGTKNGPKPLVTVVTIYYPMNYTASDNRLVLAGTQAQGLAVSNDDGMTWTKYADNPVIALPPAPYESSYKDFRDPFVFWYPPSPTGKTGGDGGHWVMIVSLAVVHKLIIYTSADLKSWTEMSYFGPYNSQIGNWECPSLFPILNDDGSPMSKWVVHLGVNPGGPAPGSGAQFFTGQFNGTHFDVDPSSIITEPSPATWNQVAQWVDWGPDYYAAAVYNGLANYRRVAIGWMNNWDYAQQIPTSPWRSAMTIPRIYTLGQVKGRDVIMQRPNMAYRTLQNSQPFKLSLNTLTSNLTLPLTWEATDLTFRFTNTTTSGQFGVSLRGYSDGSSETLIGYDFESQMFYVDRTRSGNVSFSDTFAGVYWAPLYAKNGVVTMRVLLDWSSVEVFGGDGEVVMTAQIFPWPDAMTNKFFTAGGAGVKKVSVNAKQVASAWTT